jgi:hypothetical protein
MLITYEDSLLDSIMKEVARSFSRMQTNVIAVALYHSNYLLIVVAIYDNGVSFSRPAFFCCTPLLDHPVLCTASTEQTSLNIQLICPVPKLTISLNSSLKLHSTFIQAESFLIPTGLWSHLAFCSSWNYPEGEGTPSVS